MEPSIHLVREIILRKKKGIDCTEEESAIIKSWLRETTLFPGDGTIGIAADIQHYFPLEYGEYLDEQTIASPDMTYKVSCNIYDNDFYTDSAKEARSVFNNYVADYGDGVRLYEAVKPKSNDAEIEWEIIDCHDNE